MSDNSDATPENTSLSELIDMQIRSTGPMSLANYMGLCLTHPSRGYYNAKDPIGALGDFITAPEVSQMFGELLGFFFVNLWQQMDEPKAFTLLELGPGRGTLMADLLRVGCRAPGFRDGLDLRLFETSPQLTIQQNERLEVYEPKWIDSFEKVGDGPLLVVANEFFDAMPIRQFVRATDGWHERVVGLKDKARMFGLSPTPIPASAFPLAVASGEPGEVFEVAFAGVEVMSRLAKLVSKHGGAILAIDYGYDKTQTGETLQAVRNHAYADPLEAPGESDLSAHVDFETLAATASKLGLTSHPIVTQAAFLKAIGIGERAKNLSAANPQSAEMIATARKRLTDPDQMGHLFKVLCAASPGLMPPGVTP